MKKIMFKTKYFVIAGLISLLSGPAMASVPHSFAIGDTIKSSEINANFTTLDNDISNISLTPGPQGIQGTTGLTGPQGADGQDFSPVGASVGDIRYYDGSLWQLTPAAVTISSNLNPLKPLAPLVLTLCSNVPMWTLGHCPLAIGDTGPAGGIVYYVTDGGLHGLEAAPVDQSAGAAWGCEGLDITGAAATAIGTGAENTAAILTACTDAGTAAKLADDYELNGYADWFLPSREEMLELTRQSDLVGEAANVSNYWCSSQNSPTNADRPQFINDNWGSALKSGSQRVRAIRAF